MTPRGRGRTCPGSPSRPAPNWPRWWPEWARSKRPTAFERGAVGGELARRTEARREIDCAAEDLDTLARLGGRLMVADDPDWPMAFVPVVPGRRRARSPPGPFAAGVVGSGAAGADRRRRTRMFDRRNQGRNALRRARRRRSRGGPGGAGRRGGLRRRLRHRRRGSSGHPRRRWTDRGRARRRHRRAIPRGTHRACCVASPTTG